MTGLGLWFVFLWDSFKSMVIKWRWVLNWGCLKKIFSDADISENFLSSPPLFVREDKGELLNVAYSRK